MSVHYVCDTQAGQNRVIDLLELELGIEPVSSGRAATLWNAELSLQALLTPSFILLPALFTICAVYKGRRRIFFSVGYVELGICV